MTPTSEEVFKFLLGEDQINNLWFGDPLPDSKRIIFFWWRTHLREVRNNYEALKQEVERLTKLIESRANNQMEAEIIADQNFQEGRKLHDQLASLQSSHKELELENEKRAKLIKLMADALEQHIVATDWITHDMISLRTSYKQFLIATAQPLIKP